MSGVLVNLDQLCFTKWNVIRKVQCWLRVGNATPCETNYPLSCPTNELRVLLVLLGFWDNYILEHEQEQVPTSTEQTSVSLCTVFPGDIIKQNKYQLTINSFKTTPDWYQTKYILCSFWAILCFWTCRENKNSFLICKWRLG